MAVTTRQIGPVLESWDLDTQMYQRLRDGVIEIERPFDEAELDWLNKMRTERDREWNSDQLRKRLRLAVSDNLSYLALVEAGTVTNAQHIAQIPKLTRQLDAVIRLLLASDLLDALA